MELPDFFSVSLFSFLFCLQNNSNICLIFFKVCYWSIVDLQCCVSSDQFSHSVVSELSVTPWTTTCQASLSITNSQSLLKPLSTESVMPSNHLILCRPLLLLPSIFPSIRVFSNESALHIRWPNYWSFSLSISPSNEHPGLISFRMDWLDLLAVQEVEHLKWILWTKSFFSGSESPCSPGVGCLRERSKVRKGGASPHSHVLRAGPGGVFLSPSSGPSAGWRWHIYSLGKAAPEPWWEMDHRALDVWSHGTFEVMCLDPSFHRRRD